MAPRPSLVQHGGWPFLITAMVGRQPAAMVQLGLLMYVAASGLGLDLGGLTVAAVGLGTATGANAIGRLVDRFGPFPVIIGATVIQFSALVVILQLTPPIVDGSLSRWWMLAAAFVAGSANPQVGPVARSRWSHISRRKQEPALIRIALGYEGAMDEFSFIIGPVGAGLLVSLLGPTPALLSLLAIIVVGQGVFAAWLFTARHEWGDPGSHMETSGRIPVAQLLGPMVTLLAVGITFGSTQTALTALNEFRGTQHVTGIVYGAVGVGSMAASLLVVRLPTRITVGARLVTGGIVVLLAGIGFYQLPGAVGGSLLAVVLGLAVGVILVTGFSRAEQVAPSGRIASVMTMMSMCLTLGVSIGAATTGQLAEDLAMGFAPVIAAGVLAIIASVLIIVTRRRGASVSSRGREPTNLQ